MEKLWTLLSQVHVNPEGYLAKIVLLKKKRNRNDCVDPSCWECIRAKEGFKVELKRRKRD